MPRGKYRQSRMHAGIVLARGTPRCVKIDDSLYSTLTDYAQSNRYTISECIEVAIIDFLNARLKPNDSPEETA